MIVDNEETKMFINGLLCPKCNKKFDEPFSCKICKTTFCKKHIKNEKKCPSCNEETEFEKNFLFDRILQGDCKFVCDCGSEFEKEEDLNFHKKNCVLKSFECRICNFKSKVDNEIYNHIKKDHKNELLKEFAKEVK